MYFLTYINVEYNFHRHLIGFKREDFISFIKNQYRIRTGILPMFDYKYLLNKSKQKPKRSFSAELMRIYDYYVM